MKDQYYIILTNERPAPFFQSRMGSACTSESRSPSPVYGRNGVILKRPPSVTSYELKMERMNAEVAEARAKQRIAENIRSDFEKDRDKLKRVKQVLLIFRI